MSFKDFDWSLVLPAEDHLVQDRMDNPPHMAPHPPNPGETVYGPQIKVVINQLLTLQGEAREAYVEQQRRTVQDTLNVSDQIPSFMMLVADCVVVRSLSEDITIGRRCVKLSMLWKRFAARECIIFILLYLLVSYNLQRLREVGGSRLRSTRHAVGRQHQLGQVVYQGGKDQREMYAFFKFIVPTTSQHSIVRLARGLAALVEA